MSYVPDQDAVIYLQASSTVIYLGERVLIFIHGEKGNGYSLPDGTMVYLSASRGTLPAEVMLQDGKATAEYQADETFNGDVEIKARSGQGKIVPESLVITVADRVVESLSIWAEPTQLPFGGGQCRIEVLALDALQKPVPGKIVFLSTNAGVLSAGGARTTDAQGKVQSQLDTTKDTIVTVSYKNLSNSVSVRITEANSKPVADFVFSPKEPLSGETVNFNASASYDNDGTIVSYQWDFGDGSSASGKIVSHVYNVSQKQSFWVVLKVTDNDGDEDTKIIDLTVSVTDNDIVTLFISADPEELPFGGGRSQIEVLALDALQNPVPGKIVFLSTSAGTLSAGGARMTDVQGRVLDQLNTTLAAVVTVKYKNISNTVSVRIAEANSKPVADFVFSPTEPLSGETVNFNASASYDNDGYIISYKWDFGDGASASGKIVSHVYNVSQKKTFFVLLKVTDNAGAEGVKSTNLTVSLADNDITTLLISADPEELPFGGGRSQIEVLALDSFQKPSSGKIVFLSTSQGKLQGGGARTTDAQGRVQAQLITTLAAVVTVKYKNLSSMVSVRIADANSEPTADFVFSPTEPLSGETVNFNASASYDNDGTIVSYQWDFGDGTSTSGKIVSHVYNVSEKRSFWVVLKVTDNDGGEDVKSEKIEIKVVL